MITPPLDPEDRVSGPTSYSDGIRSSICSLWDLVRDPRGTLSNSPVLEPYQGVLTKVGDSFE